MRTIRFRGKSLDNRQWIYGDLITFQNDYEICDHNTIDGSRYDIIPKTVGQFTGLLDKNGKEIYEGDIIAFEQEINFKRAHILPMQIEWSDYGNGMVGWSQFSPIDVFVVIGTIPDNPELLKRQ